MPNRRPRGPAPRTQLYGLDDSQGQGADEESESAPHDYALGPDHCNANDPVCMFKDALHDALHVIRPEEECNVNEIVSVNNPAGRVFHIRLDTFGNWFDVLYRANGTWRFLGEPLFWGRYDFSQGEMVETLVTRHVGLAADLNRLVANIRARGPGTAPLGSGFGIVVPMLAQWNLVVPMLEHLHDRILCLEGRASLGV